MVIYWLLMLLCSAFLLGSVWSVYRVTRARSEKPVRRGGGPSVTVLKPLCGADEQLEANLDTFFVQDYHAFELLFGVEGDVDPAIAVVQRLRARYPQVRAQLVVHNGGKGINPKVSNLRRMLRTASYDVVLVSDSNIAAPATYLADTVRELQGDNVGLVSNLFAGSGEVSLGAHLENLHINGPIAGSFALSAQLDRCISVGKSMMFRRSVLESLGGLESVATLLAEDYVIGRMFRTAGYSVRLAPTIIQNVAVNTSVATFIRRHLRWSLLRSRLKPLSYPFEPLGNAFAVALCAPFFGIGAAPIWLWALGLTALRDGSQWFRLRGTGGLATAVALGPMKEFIALAIWAAAPFRRHVSWRGRRYRVSAGTRLYAEGPAPIV